MKKQDRMGRRRFLKNSAYGLVAATTIPVSISANALSAHATSAPEVTTGNPGAFKVSRELFPQQELLNQRSRKSKTFIEESLAKKDARPVVAGVFQMRNYCAGLKGKEERLQRMLTAITTARREGVQILAFPEMCLPG